MENGFVLQDLYQFAIKNKRKIEGEDTHLRWRQYVLSPSDIIFYRLKANWYYYISLP